MQNEHEVKNGDNSEVSTISDKPREERQETTSGKEQSEKPAAYESTIIDESGNEQHINPIILEMQKKAEEYKAAAAKLAANHEEFKIQKEVNVDYMVGVLERKAEEAAEKERAEREEREGPPPSNSIIGNVLEKAVETLATTTDYIQQTASVVTECATDTLAKTAEYVQEKTGLVPEDEITKGYLVETVELVKDIATNSMAFVEDKVQRAIGMNPDEDKAEVETEQ